MNVDFFKRYGDSPIPHFFGLTSEKSIEAAGINRLRRTPNLNLRGKGVLVGIIDTGIDYTNPIFIRPDGTSKIAALWDQSIDSDNQFPANTFYGTEYTREQINQALKSANPFDIVPSKDIIGHGTMLAGIAVGSEVPASELSGVAPDADLIVIKLKEAKNALRKFMEYPLDVPCYQENDIMWAVQYMIETAMNLNRPLSICIGLGSSQGPHNGRGPLNAAPGVDIIVPDLQHKFTTASGTGVAAAFTAGVAAMMLEWGVVKGFYSEINTVDIKKFLIRGAKRSKQLQYPNRDWGYGIIDVYNVFNILRTSFLK